MKVPRTEGESSTSRQDDPGLSGITALSQTEVLSSSSSVITSSSSVSSAVPVSSYSPTQTPSDPDTVTGQPEHAMEAEPAGDSTEGPFSPTVAVNKLLESHGEILYPNTT